MSRKEPRRLPHSQGVRAFLSFDLAGSAAVKSSPLASFPVGTKDAYGVPLKPHWLPVFLELFTDLPDRLHRALQAEFVREPNIQPFTLELWRLAGDEVLFVTSRLQSPHQLALLAKVTYAVLLDADHRLGTDPLAGVAKELGLKSVLWAAGFPIRNSVVELQNSAAPFVRQPAQFFTLEEYERLERERSTLDEPTRAVGSFVREYLGPEIDLGFRLGPHTFPGRLLISIDVAELIAEVCLKLSRSLRPQFHHVGWTTLKGLYGGRPYPLIWIDYGHAPQLRTSFEETASPLLERYLSGRASRQVEAILDLSQQYLQDTRDTRIKMYIEPIPTGNQIEIYNSVLGGKEP